jgi:hypothetical protein
VRDEADQQGLVPGDTPVADKVAAVIKATGEKAEEIAHRAASGLTEPSSPSESSPGSQTSKTSPGAGEAAKTQASEGKTPPTSPKV